MEMINIGKDIEKTYYLQSSDDFYRIFDIINLMPSFAIAKTYETEHFDYYFETPDYFLKNLDASIRVRKYPDKKEQILSIVCKNLGTKREFVLNMEYGDEIADKDDYLFFLEDKLQDIYLHRFEFDVIRILKTLKKFVVIENKRKVHEIINNQGFKANVFFDNVTYVSKRNKNHDAILEIKLDCWKNEDNMFFFEKFVKEVEHKVIMIPMNEKKYDAALRSFNMEY